MSQQNYIEAEQQRILEKRFAESLKRSIDLAVAAGIDRQEDWEQFIKGWFEGYFMIAKKK